jgi:ribosome-associated protein
LSFPSDPGPNGECGEEFHTDSAGRLEPQEREPKAPEAQPTNQALAQEIPAQKSKTGKLQTLEPSELRLDQFLKWQGLVGTGGEAKFRIQQGDVQVNGALEQRRGRKLQPGDRVRLAGQELVVPPFEARR